MAMHEGTVLIVDDNLDACASLAMLAMIEGFSPVMAANGAKALAYLAEHPAPCFIILDMVMPVMDGWEFLARKHSVPDLARIPVLIATGREGTIDLDNYPEVVSVVYKPVAPEKIFDILKDYHVPRQERV
jgi:CheY-like chemotaxis protein